MNNNNNDSKFNIITNCNSVNWDDVANLLKSVGMAYHAPEVHKRAFEASHTTIFIYQSSKLIGIGRAISDGEYQGAIYDIAILSECQGQGIGKIIINTIIKSLPNCNLILYATPGMEMFYQKMGFQVMTTAMAIFTTPAAMKKFTKMN